MKEKEIKWTYVSVFRKVHTDIAICTREIDKNGNIIVTMKVIKHEDNDSKNNPRT